MGHLQKSTDGHLLKHSNGHLADECCCAPVWTGCPCAGGATFEIDVDFTYCKPGSSQEFYCVDFVQEVTIDSSCSVDYNMGSGYRVYLLFSQKTGDPTKMIVSLRVYKNIPPVSFNCIDTITLETDVPASCDDMQGPYIIYAPYIDEFSGNSCEAVITITRVP